MGPRLLDEDLQGRLKKPVASAAADCDSVGEVRHPDVSTLEAVALNQPYANPFSAAAVAEIIRELGSKETCPRRQKSNSFNVPKLRYTDNAL